MEPTRVHKLAPGEPAYKGTLNTSEEGAGGGWVHGTKEIASIVWQVKFPLDVAESLATEDNPGSDITNSALEMVA